MCLIQFLCHRISPRQSEVESRKSVKKSQNDARHIASENIFALSLEFATALPTFDYLCSEEKTVNHRHVTFLSKVKSQLRTHLVFFLFCRRFRIKRGSKREELARFLWYGLYAWGTPFLIAAIVVTLDNIDISYMGIVKPPFESCFHDEGLYISLYPCYC